MGIDFIPSICRAKKSYASWAFAQKVARQVSHRHKKRVEVYRCPICSKCHIGGQDADVELKRFKRRKRELREHEYDEESP